MRNRSKLLAAGVFAGIAAAVLAAWLCAGKSQRQAGPPVAPEPNPLAVAAAPANPAPTPPAVTKQPPAAPASIPVWQHRIDAVLESPADASQTALILLGLFPNLPAEGQVQAAHHIANLLADADYDKLKPVLLNPATNKEALEVLYADLMNRPDPAKLRTLLDMAKIQNHPLSEEARGTLAILLGEDDGADWAKWSSAIDSYVAGAASPQ